MFWCRFQEKYGPKGQVKALNGGGAKPNKDSKQQADFDITVGLSERPPWFCRYIHFSNGCIESINAVNFPWLFMMCLLPVVSIVNL